MIAKEPISILLVEDNLGDVFLAKEALKEGRFPNTAVAVVKDGEEALDYLYKRGKFNCVEKPDLILLDINLPRMDGKEVLAIIKKDEKLRLIPVVMLTTSTAENDILESYYNHANCNISKPVHLDNFIDAISKIETFWLLTVELPTRF